MPLTLSTGHPDPNATGNHPDSTSVSAVQRAINAAGYSPALTVNGDWTDPATRSAILWFANLHHLPMPWHPPIITDQILAATIAPTPTQAAPPKLVNLPLLGIGRAMAAASISPPLLSTPVASMPNPSNAPIPKAVLNVRAMRSMAPYVPPPAATTTTPAPSIATRILPAALGAGLGAGLGLVARLPVLAALGAVGGGIAGLLFGVKIAAALRHAAAGPILQPASTMVHGEDVDFCAQDDGPSVVAGEIGMPTPAASLRG